MWLGSYEATKQLSLARTLRPGQTFYDVGANAGFFSLLGARCVGQLGSVIAVEPLPRNLLFLERHVRLNRIKNVTIEKKALGDIIGTTRFSDGGSAISRINPGGGLEVEITTLDKLVEKNGAVPDVLKVDVEGAETEVLRGAIQTILVSHPVIFMDIHSRENFDGVRRVAKEIGYHIEWEEKGREFPQEVVLRP
jgi:FkbM family methyltransferase